MTIQLVFETHSTTEDNEAALATGWLPGRLSAAGRDQARELGARRANDGLDAIFTSDLGRALETVEIAFAGSHVPVFHDWRLRECDYGAQNGGPTADLDRPGHVEVPYPSGESWTEAIARVGRFLRDLEPRWADRRVLVIGHTATRWAFDHLIDGVAIEDLVAAPFSWQEGWEYRLG
jgi:2,3-bisphosphoglycerate-dependent phosphoglycerate mutase